MVTREFTVTTKAVTIEVLVLRQKYFISRRPRSSIMTYDSALYT